MGNISSMARASTALDSYVAELGNDISYDKSLSSSRFLKTILARHAYGPIVLKIFIKPDASMSLRLIQNRLKKERDALKDLPGTATYQAFVETDKAGYLIRQWTGSNLYDRVSTQPYLAGIEKKWIAFQLLTSLRDARTLSIAHGDIKSENVLITSDLSVLLTDFSSAFKPTFLPLDDPSDFSFFFDTSNRRTCYIAPERFYSADSTMAASKRVSSSKATDNGDAWQKRDPPPTEVMDVFSAACVLAEMWTDGRTVFNLSELYAYRDGSLSLDGILDNIEDSHVQDMIRQMLSRDPEERPTFDRILTDYRETIFPEYFYTFLKDYAASLGELSAGQGQGFVQRSAAQLGTKIDRMLDEWESISVHLTKVDENGPALLLLNIVTSSIRNCLWPSSRLHGLQLFLRLSPFLLDEDKIDRIVPFIVELLSDDVAIVRAEACRVLVTIVESITSITPFNAPFIPEYLLPQMRYLSTDPDVFVRATYARALVRLADAAVNMLEMSQAKIIKSDDAGIDSYDSMLLEIQSIVEEQATTLLVDPSSNVKRAILAGISDLCLFFGRQKSNETVLSHMMTYLNDRDWHLRLAFFDGIVGVGAFIGIKAIEEYVLPLMLQALADSEEAVVARVISSLTSLAALGLLSRMRLWDVFFAIRGFLCHPDAWIRQSTVGFVSVAARNLPASDTWCILYPSLRSMLKGDVLELDEESIMASLITPLSRAALTAAKNAALANSPPGFWDVPYSGLSAKTQLTKTALAAPTNPSPQLRDKGISSKDERKIVAMKEFIVKQAYASRAREAAESSSSENSLVNGKSVALGELGVPPQTVFISPRTVGVDATANLRRLRPHLTEGSSSRRTSFASRATNPVDDIRKRLASTEIKPSVPPSHRSGPSTSTLPASQSDVLSESGISTSLEFSALTRPAKKRVEPKVAPAIAAVHTTAMGTTSHHDDTMSGRTTPSAMTPRAASAIGGAAYSSTYEGQDPGVRAFLDQMDLDNYREPQLDFGPRVTASTRKRRIKPPPGGGQGGNVTLIAQMSDHKGAITGLVASPDNLWFASTGEDRAVLIWDSARLERSVITKPRLAYMMNAPISCICRIENTHCLAVGAEDGQLMVLRVHVAGSKYLKIEAIRNWQVPDGDGYVKFVTHQESSLLVVTSNSIIASLDIRTLEITKRYQNPLEHGVITAVCVQKNWLIVGTETGVLSLWDLRFGLLLKPWMTSGAINSLALHPARGKVNDEALWLVAAIQRTNEDSPVVEVYSVESGKLVETYEIRQTKPSKSTASPTETPMPDKAGLIAKIAAAQNPFGSSEDPPPSVLSLLVGHRFPSMANAAEESTGGLISTLTERPAPPAPAGYMVTAGEDRVVRYWDLVKPAEGFVICGSPKDKEVSFRQSQGSTPALYYTLPTRSSDKASAVKIPPQPLRPHYDAIGALGHVETPFSSCVISGDRSGVLKVWRMEGGATASKP